MICHGIPANVSHPDEASVEGRGFLRGAMAIWLQTKSKAKSETHHVLTPAPNYAIPKPWAKFLFLVHRNLCQ